MSILLIPALLAALLEMLLPIAIVIGIIFIIVSKKKYVTLTDDRSWEGYFQFLKAKYWSRK